PRRTTPSAPSAAASGPPSGRASSDRSSASTIARCPPAARMRAIAESPRSWPSTGIWVRENGSSTLAPERPICTAIVSPAVSAAATNTAAPRPSVIPTRSSETMAGTVTVAPAPEAIAEGQSSRVRRTVTPALRLPGTVCAENTGAVHTSPRSRIERSAATAAPAGSSISRPLTVGTSAHQGGQSAQELAHVAHHDLQHPGQQDHERRAHREQLRHERERLLLDRRHGLEDADDEADGEGNAEQ